MSVIRSCASNLSPQEEGHGGQGSMYVQYEPQINNEQGRNE
jgi:hypothetical protein